MYFHGSFLTQLGETVSVHIVTGNSRVKTVEIGDDKSGVFFTANPVEITSSVNDTFDHLLRSSATIRLLTRDFIQELFCTSCMDAVVNIFKGGKCVFAGFIEPQAYSQPYNEVYDELEISCVDALSALQYAAYRNVGGFGVVYEAVKASAGQRLFDEIVREILDGVCTSIDIIGISPVRYYYDGSKALTSASDRYGIFSQLSISELLFLGDGEDDVWKQDKVLEAILKYLNLHIVQDGTQFYIFSWESVKGRDAISWHGLNVGTPKTTAKSRIEIGLNNVASNDTAISIGEVYNRILITCDIESVDGIVENPLEASELTSPYTNKQLYMTEYSTRGDKNGDKDGYNDFWEIIHGNAATRDAEAKIRDWYVRVKRHPRWRFPTWSRYSDRDTVEEYCTGRPQHVLPDALHPNWSIQGAIVSIGSVERNADGKDNSATAKVDMTDCLVIGINGIEATKYPTGDFVRGNVPLAVYEGASSGAALSPCDDGTVNYIVFSGRILLNPHVNRSDTYNNLRTKGTAGTGHWDDYPNWPKPMRCGEWKNDGSDPKYRYYATQYWEAATPTAAPTWDTGIKEGLMPPVDDGLKRFQYESAKDKDVRSKMPVLRCMLVVGDKCVKETGTKGRPSDFEWVDYKPREECKDFDEWLSQSFTLGFDPKIGDYLVGTEYAMQNNIDISMGLDAEGTAIPIRFSDHISGAVRFQILCPVDMSAGQDMDLSAGGNGLFGPIRNPQSPILPVLDNIILKGFEAKVYSDNGRVEELQDNDVVYVTDTKEAWTNSKEDISFEINSALTSEERQRMGVSDMVKLSVPVDTSTGVGLLSIYDCNRRQQAKPEQLYADSYYTEYHKPRILMVQKFDDRENIVGLFNHYRHPAMADKLFFVQGVSRNLIEGYAELTIKEIDS